MTTTCRASDRRRISGILQTARYNAQAAAERLGLEENLVTRIIEPKERISLRLNPALESGRVPTLKAFLVRHSDILGPSKGGIRMAPHLTLEDVEGLALEMTWKTALIGVPFGGGKAGIACDPYTLSARDKETIIRSFTRNVRRHLGPELYVPAPDMGTNSEDMGHIWDCISYSEGIAIPRGCFVTGKPLLLGGIPGREEATGKGVATTVNAACRKLGLKVEELRIAVQGFGNVGMVAGRELARRGARVIAVQDLSGSVFCARGLDVEALSAHVRTRGGVEGFPEAEALSREEFFAVNCSCLIPAATGSQITEHNAGRIRARIIAEGANAPTTPAADEILQERGIFVIPDILCNAGGVFVSYLEYTQETQHEQMTQTDVERRLAECMHKCFDEVYEYTLRHRRTMRQAAMDIAMGRVVQGLQARSSEGSRVGDNLGRTNLSITLRRFPTWHRARPYVSELSVVV